LIRDYPDGRQHLDMVTGMSWCMGRRLGDWLDVTVDRDNRDDIYDATFGACAADRGEKDE
jgi:hypothetical protein